VGAAPVAADAKGEVQHAPADVYVTADTPEEAGKYIIGWLGNCNDCHTPGWGTRPYEGRVPLANWLMGGEKSTLAAGVTFSANLRLVPGKATVNEFISWFRTRQNPRMPWDYFRDLNDKDLTSVYDFLKQLGPKGEAATPYATSTPKPTADPAAPTADAAVPTATKAPATATVPVPTATPRPDMLATDAIEKAPSSAYVKAATPELAGEYIIWVGRCNSCHTADSKGVANWSPTMPKDDWLMGGRRFAGNYGTVFSANLRLVPTKYPTVAEFLKMMKGRTANPPMPWFALHQWNEKDLTAVYAFLKELGPKGEAVPAPVPPQTATPVK
jgi:mono/diheme cytochrome c family protein